MINRRSLITGLISLIAAPAIVRAGSLMPVKSMPASDAYLVADMQVHGPYSKYVCSSMWTKGRDWELGETFTLFGHEFSVNSITGSSPGWLLVTGVLPCGH